MPDIYEWEADYTGRICIDGMALNGTQGTLAKFQGQYYPGAVFLECGGECDCELRLVSAAAPDPEKLTPEPTTPVSTGMAGSLILLDGVVKAPDNQNPKPKNPKGNNNPDGTTTDYSKNPRGGAMLIENNMRIKSA